jgi:pimeloyl-ACP methyl ester carboxylesterase
VSPPVHLEYETAGSREQCLSFGPATASRTILIAPPLYDEMNRTRRMLVEAMRALAEENCRTLLPDLPGCNESRAELASLSLDHWRAAIADCARQLGATHIASVRGGCLIDDAAALPVWRLAPVKGASLLKTMFRTRIAADKEVGISTSVDELRSAAAAAPIALSGHLLGSDMVATLESAEPLSVLDVREVTLADISGTALWLRAEPGEDAMMSKAVARHLAGWNASCGG